MADGNSAYDHLLQNNPHNPQRNYRQQNEYNHEPKYRHAEPKPKPKQTSDITMKRITPKKGSVPKVFLAALAVLGIFSCVLYGKVESNKVYNQISDENQKLEILQSENVRLQSELESKMTLKNVEEYASEVLGLQKLENSQIEYVQTQTDDVIEIPEKERNVFVRIKDDFNRLIEYLFG